ncbi:TPR repeat protein [Yoonia maricola]|uniref:TPR repeat protein n=2 Tax=Yoonia maricola TaxID=420999 RepID=A0A2M8W2M4_9RHOB|nr:TPR repeat protein [Yoonia maricola]
MFRALLLVFFLSFSAKAFADETLDRLSVEELTNLGRIAQAEHDYARALECYRAALEKGNSPRAVTNIGLMYLNGHGVPKDVEHGIELLREAAETGHPNAMMVLGATLGGRGKTEDENTEARDWLQRAANAGNVRAMSFLAEAFRYGVGIPSHPDDANIVRQNARASLQQEADAGDNDARLALGRIYKLGIQVPADHNRAEALFLAGASSGHVIIRRYLGSLYLDEMGRYEDAYQVFKDLADEGDHGGMNHLQRMYAYGVGAEKDLAIAAEWALKSARATGNAHSLFHPINGLQAVRPEDQHVYVQAIQTILRDDDFYSGPIDGDVTDSLRQALSQYIGEN